MRGYVGIRALKRVSAQQRPDCFKPLAEETDRLSWSWRRGHRNSAAACGDIQSTAHGVQLLRARGRYALTDEALGHRVHVVEIEDAFPRHPVLGSEPDLGRQCADHGGGGTTRTSLKALIAQTATHSCTLGQPPVRNCWP